MGVGQYGILEGTHMADVAFVVSDTSTKSRNWKGIIILFNAFGKKTRTIGIYC